MPLGVGLFTLLTGSVLMTTRLKNRPRPWGMMECVKAPAGMSVAPVYLSKHAHLLSDQVTIGSRRGADLRLFGDKIAPDHAQFRATDSRTYERVGKPPKLVPVDRLVTILQSTGGPLKVNNQLVPMGQLSVPLLSGMRVGIGDYEFIYRE